jgi:hypothetical protein
MALKASELLAQFSDIKEEIRKKKAVLQFEHCGICGGKLEFIYDRRPQEQTIVERGHCSHCQEPLQPRQFRLC